MQGKYQINFVREKDEVLSEINTTPLVDVMLVLLIIFLITIPVFSTSLLVDPPSEKNCPGILNDGSLIITVDSRGNYYVGEDLMTSLVELSNFLKGIGEENPDEVIYILSDKESKFQSVGVLLSVIKKAGLANIAFLTKPSSLERKGSIN